MKTKQVQRILLICGLVGIASLIFWRLFHEHSKPAAAGSLPSTERLRAFSLTNAPTTPVSGSWSTNQPVDPFKALVMQRVAASVRANQTNHTPASTPTMAAGIRDAEQAEALRRLQNRVGSSLQVVGADGQGASACRLNAANYFVGLLLPAAVGNGDQG